MKTLILIIILLVFFGIAGATIFYASQPALTEQEMSPVGIRHYSSPAIHELVRKRKTLKVVSYNIGYGSGAKNNRPLPLSKDEVRDNLDNMILELQQLDADVIALQEVDFEASRTHDIDQLEYLARGLNMEHAAYVITWNKRYIAWPYWPPSAQFGRLVSGQALLSRYPIIDQETFRFEKPKENPFWYNMFYLDRIAQRLTLQIQDKVAVVWNIHLEAFRSETRLAQMTKLSGYIKGDPHKIIIMAGDFNVVSVKPFINSTGLQDASVKGFSFPSWKPLKKIDYVLYKGLKKTKSGIVSDLKASDHLPVWAEFELN